MLLCNIHETITLSEISWQIVVEQLFSYANL